MGRRRRAYNQSANAMNRSKGETPSPPKERQRRGKSPAVCNQIPVPRESPHSLHVGERNVTILENLVRRLRRVNHLVLAIMPHDRCAAETLQMPTWIS
jgi:hypothetical protein